MEDTNKLITFMTQTNDHGERIALQYDRYNRLYISKYPDTLDRLEEITA